MIQNDDFDSDPWKERLTAHQETRRGKTGLKDSSELGHLAAGFAQPGIPWGETGGRNSGSLVTERVGVLGPLG